MTTKISNFLVKLTVFFAVIGIIFLLTMYNAKLLYVLNWFKTSNSFYDKIIIIVAAVAYSLGSIAVVIWYNPEKEDDPKLFILKYIGSIFLKIIFVAIDGFHVYIYNNSHIDDLALWLSPVYALQTALILFFLGAIVNDNIKPGKISQSKIKKLGTYYEGYLKYKASHIRKKKKENRTKEDDKLLLEAEAILNDLT